MSKKSMLEIIEDYFNNTSQEELEKAWKKAEEATKGVNSPTVAEYLEYSNKEMCKWQQEVEQHINN